MRTWVEKLAKAIEKEGIYIHRSVKIGNLEIHSDIDYNDMSKYIIFYDHKYGSRLKIYEDEFDCIKTSIEKCRQKAEDYFINLINNLE